MKMKTRSGDLNQELEADMPVKESKPIKQELLEVEDTRSNQRRAENVDSYSEQANPGWGRELRNRFVFSNSEHNRSLNCNLRSPFTDSATIGSRGRHVRSCRMSVSLDERGRVYEDDEMVEDSDDIAMYEDDDDDDDDIFSPVKRRERVRRQASRRQGIRASLSHRQKSNPASHDDNRGRTHTTRQIRVDVEEVEEDDEELDSREMNGHASNLEKREPDDNNEGEGVRRSTRQRKLIYDNFNTSWILGTQTLRGYPMFLTDKVGERSNKELRQEQENVQRDADPDERKEVHKKRRVLSELEPAVIDNDYEDMYSRVKRPRRPVQTIMFSTQKSKTHAQKLAGTDGSEDEPTETQSSRSSTDESGADGPKYHLRKTKPTVDRFQVNVEPPRRSSRILRSVLCNSVRRRRHRAPARDDSSSSSSDEERFDRKKNKNHNKSRSRCIPLNFNAGDIQSSSKTGRGPGDHKQIVSTLADVDPMSLDCNIRFCHVGGLENHIRCLKEMVVFPIMYREVFEKFHIQPPKGVLFHGPPGTGKTLLARALANECSQGDHKVSFFMRKGADCLSKWVGESERQLRLLFDQAYQMRPSIIFFDEIDGLAPVRSSKQDQIHASIVSTLLALMDGLDNRGDIIVIGATNRIDAIDPALRRPGRFDRELYFPLPAKKERQEILKIHVSQWDQPPSSSLLNQLAEQAVGYCGSDLRALCSEAVIHGLRRRYPQIYKSSQKLLLDPSSVKVERVDFIRARCNIVPSGQRVTPNPGRKLAAFIEPLLKKPLENAIRLLKDSFPCGLSRSVARILGFSRAIHRPRLLLTGSTPLLGQTSHLGPALLHFMEHIAVHTLDLTSLYEVSGRSPEEACVQVFQEARRNVPSIIYVPAVAQWWNLVPETLHVVFLSNLNKLEAGAPVLLLATADCSYNSLPSEICCLFSDYRGEVLVLKEPGMQEREAFFKPLFLTEALRPPKEIRKSYEHEETLPLAPPPEPIKLSEEELRVVYEKEEAVLRELRIFLREICAKLARNRQFFMFTKPVDVEEVPDYLTIIKQPMDLETMMTKIDLHRYACAQDFLDDIDLLCRNALEYNPDRDPADKLIRHRACSLRDTAYALIKAEMDSEFEQQCKEISKARRQRAESPSRFAPEFVHTKPSAPHSALERSDALQSKVDVTKEVLSVAANEEVKPSIHTAPSGTPAGPQVLKKRVWKFGTGSETSRSKKRKTWAKGFISTKRKVSVRRVTFPTATTVSSANVSTESSCTSATQDVTAPAVADEGLPWSLDDAVQDNSNNGLIVTNGMHRSCPAIFSDLNFGKTDLSNEDISQDVNKTTIPKNTLKSSLCPKSVECCMEDGLNDNDVADDLTSFCDGASQDDAAELNSGQSSNNGSVGKPSDLEKKEVQINIDELKRLLNRSIKITKHYPLESLVELYIQLSKCVGKYSKSHDRTTLPQELEMELRKFEEYKSTANHTAS